MSTSCPVCGLLLHPEHGDLVTVGGYLAHAGACAAVLATALHDQPAGSQR